MAGWFRALGKTRRQLGGLLAKVFGGKLDEDTLEDLETRLIQADIPVRIVQLILDDLEEGRHNSPEKARAAVRHHLLSLLGESPDMQTAGASPYTILIVGINGSGKTTTCAKLAAAFKREGKKPMLCAGDTFRAAGSSQLGLWADKVGVPVVIGATGADAAAVAYDGMASAVARKADVLIVDTAGRMHTKAPLLEELKKVKRALGKVREGAPDETWIVLDASLGQNAVNQARVFHEQTPLTGCVIAKLDGSAKGGFLFAVRNELGIPIRYVGLGEQMDDLAPFDPDAYVDALLGREEDLKPATQT